MCDPHLLASQVNVSFDAFLRYEVPREFKTRELHDDLLIRRSRVFQYGLKNTYRFLNPTSKEIHLDRKSIGTMIEFGVLKVVDVAVKGLGCNLYRLWFPF